MMNNFYHLAWPIDPEADYYERVNQQHDECGCEGVADPCECVTDCPVCLDIQEGRRFNFKA